MEGQRFPGFLHAPNKKPRGAKSARPSVHLSSSLVLILGEKYFRRRCSFPAFARLLSILQSELGVGLT